MSELIEKIITEFNNRFNDEPVIIQSPGRVNLIGEHTDYNDGFVLPAAINRSMVFAFGDNKSNICRIYAADMDDEYELNLDRPDTKEDSPWTNYILGVIKEIQKKRYQVSGFDCVFGGDVPIGAGLSSSAALEGGLIYGLSEIFELKIPRHEMPLIGQRAENEFVGVQCGIMDQFVNIFGEKGYALKLDCRSLEFQRIPFTRTDIDIVLCDTGIRRELAASEYNIRREQCEKGVAILLKKDSSVKSLRDADIALLQSCRKQMDPVIYQRCEYVIEENKRVHEACKDLFNENFEAFGQRMYESHYGLRDKYQVSCTELNTLVEIAENHDGVLGARMMGGGFGGCTINLVESEATESFIAKTNKIYQAQTGETLDIYRVAIDEGTHEPAKSKI